MGENVARRAGAGPAAPPRPVLDGKYVKMWLGGEIFSKKLNFFRKFGFTWTGAEKSVKNVAQANLHGHPVKIWVKMWLKPH